MRRLLDFLYAQREIGVFAFLVIVSTWLIIRFNQRPNAAFLNSSNSVAASVTQSTSDISGYFELAEVNERLMEENALLQSQLRKLSSSPDSYFDTLGRYQVIGARVIANTFERSSNFLTVSAGENRGVEPGMGVISSNGIVGQVKSVSRNFASVYSVLHPNLLVSSKVKRTQTKGTIQWDQVDFLHARLKYVPRHIRIQEGDSIVTSGFNSVFPHGLPIGVIDNVRLDDEMTFYDVRVKLATDFTSLDYVYLIKDLLKPEIDSLTVVE